MINECELKFRIVDKDQNVFLHKKVQDIGACFVDYRQETDYVIDLDQINDKGKGMMLRIRQIYSHDILQDVLITLKIPNRSNYCLNNAEIEYSLEKQNDQNIIQINNILLNSLGIQIRFDLLILKDANVHTVLEKENLIKYVLEYSKQREEYRFESCKILFDSFVDSIGDFIEIEAKSEIELKNMLQILQLNYEDCEKRNYGRILRDGF